jgi:prepilin-type N-terminal cleavage/methylation domain-containing protein
MRRKPIFWVSVAWQGEGDTVAPDATASACGAGLYGTAARRRLVTLSVATCLPGGSGMLMTMRHSRRPAADSRQRGLTLVEVMVAMTIGIILLLALGTLFANSTRVFKVNDDFARMQENGPMHSTPLDPISDRRAFMAISRPMT